VRSPGHRRAAVPPAEGDQRAGEIRGGGRRFRQADPGEQAQVQSDLVVAAPAGVHPPAQLAQLFRQAAFDRQMHVLVGQGDGEPAGRGVGQNLAQFGDHALDGGRGQQRGLDGNARQHGGMRGGSHAFRLDQRQVQDAVAAGRVGQHLGIHLPHRRPAAHPSAGSA